MFGGREGRSDSCGDQSRPHSVAEAEDDNTGSNAWMLTAATLVGLQSVPGLMLLYGGMTKRKYAINTMMMVLYAFAVVLIVWILAGYEFAFASQANNQGKQ